ncbi:MAG: purine-nucleoside phosphorylase [Pseudomonadales bacterium]
MYAMNLHDKLKLAHESVGSDYRADVCLMLGTGLGDCLKALEERGLQIDHSIPYDKIKHFPHSQVVSHKGELCIARMGETRLVIFQGRFHLYEGWSGLEAAMPAYLAWQMGARAMLVSNAAGALNTNLNVGKLMLIEDHLNFTGHNPLQGWQDESIGPQFVDMARCYDPELAQMAHKAAKECGVAIGQGIYAGVLGPSLETSAERRWLRASGGDAVGMSTIMEVIAARQCKLRVLGFSAISNIATGAPNQPSDSIETVVANAALAAKDLAKLLATLLNEINAAITDR